MKKLKIISIIEIIKSLILLKKNKNIKNLNNKTITKKNKIQKHIIFHIIKIYSDSDNSNKTSTDRVSNKSDNINIKRED